MSRLIYAEDAIEAIFSAFSYAYCDNCENSDKDDYSCDECHRKYQNWSASRNTIERVINNLPSAESEIIRCRDCKHHRYESDDIMPYCLNIDCGYGWKDDDFCSYAERKVR